MIKCPILLTDGANDESTPLQNKMMYDALTCEKKWVIFAHSRHMSYYEEYDKYEAKQFETHGEAFSV